MRPESPKMAKIAQEGDRSSRDHGIPGEVANETSGCCDPPPSRDWTIVADARHGPFDVSSAVCSPRIRRNYIAAFFAAFQPPRTLRTVAPLGRSWPVCAHDT